MGNSESGNAMEVLKLVYEDAFAPSARNVGIALGLVTESAMHATRITKLEEYNLRKNITLRENLKQIKDRLQNLDEEKLREVPSEIAHPIIDRLSYMENRDLSELFIELLAKSADQDSDSIVHPAFIRVIDSLSPDEARILVKVSKERNNRAWAYPKITYGCRNPDPKMMGQRFVTSKCFCSLHLSTDNLDYSSNMDLYIENMEALGLIDLKDDCFLPQLDTKTRKNVPSSEYKILENKARKLHALTPPLEFFSSTGMLSFTEFGKKFVSSVTTI